jgi:outer membrane protein assembly factor BamD (BamD/ComL family)
VEIFEKITERFEGTPEESRAWFELGYIFQHMKGDLEKAREYYQKAAMRSTDPDLAPLARRRVKAIDGIFALQQREPLQDSTIARDTTYNDTVQAQPDTIRPEYRIGELFWLELDEPDSALDYFLTLSADTTVDDSLQMKSLYSPAWICLNVSGDSSRADSLYDILVERYPHTVYSKRAQLDRNIPLTMKTRRDSAEQDFLTAEELYTKQDNPLGAVNAWYKVYTSYPDLDIAGKSLLAAARTCDDVLHKNETALRLYRKLCNEFPRSEYCMQGARPRLRAALDTLKALEDNGAER